MHLKYQYNVKESITLAHDLKKLTIDEHHKMITFDIKDLYVNIPIKDTIKITEDMLSEHNNELITQQITILLKTTLEQNYFTFLDKLYQPEKGVSMGSPLSNTIAEIFLQHLEQIYLKQLLDANTIIFYTR